MKTSNFAIFIVNNWRRHRREIDMIEFYLTPSDSWNETMDENWKRIHLLLPCRHKPPRGSVGWVIACVQKSQIFGFLRRQRSFSLSSVAQVVDSSPTEPETSYNPTFQWRARGKLLSIPMNTLLNMEINTRLSNFCILISLKDLQSATTPSPSLPLDSGVLLKTLLR